MAKKGPRVIKKGQREVTVKKCAYCGRKYEIINGMDINLGACNRPACVLQSMRDHI